MMEHITKGIPDIRWCAYEGLTEEELLARVREELKTWNDRILVLPPMNTRFEPDLEDTP